MSFSPKERESLTFFRRAARQVRESSIIAEGQVISLDPLFTPDGSETVSVTPLAEEPFRSMAISVRLVYQQREPANFLYICGILRRSAPQEHHSRVDQIRAGFQGAMTHPLGWVTVPVGASHRTFSPQEVLETWLYAVAFHQDRSRQEDYNLLLGSGGHFHLAVQSTALLVAGRVLDLDDLIADVLGEPRLPRIPRNHTGRVWSE